MPVKFFSVDKLNLIGPFLIDRFSKQSHEYNLKNRMIDQ